MSHDWARLERGEAAAVPDPAARDSAHADLVADLVNARDAAQWAVGGRKPDLLRWAGLALRQHIHGLWGDRLR
jgi:hypothetical protein